MKKLKQFFRHRWLSRGWRIVRHPAAILAMDVVELGAVEYLSRSAADEVEAPFIPRQLLLCRCIKLKAHGQPILEKTKEKPMRLSLTISYHYFSPLSMG